MDKLVISELTQIYKSGKGIFDVSFSVKEGEVFGYIGPNGAGKTTTIRNILGFTNATKGSARINGLDCRKHPDQIQHLIGYLPGEIAFFDNMTGNQFIKFNAGMNEHMDMSIAKKLMKRFDIDPSSKIKRMSKGMKQKIGIISAFMHDPEILILDEPTSGLDPLMQKEFLDLVNEEKAKGKTILMSSHSFDEVEKCCDRVGIIKDGRIVTIQDVVTMKKEKLQTYKFTFGDSIAVQKIHESGFRTKIVGDKQLQISITDNLKELLSLISQYDVLAMEVVPQTLENEFMKYYVKGGSK